MSFDDKDLILNINKWPGETLCMKRKAKEGEKRGITGCVFGVLTNNTSPFIIYLTPNYITEEKYSNVDEMLKAGWVVD